MAVLNVPSLSTVPDGLFVTESKTGFLRNFPQLRFESRYQTVGGAHVLTIASYGLLLSLPKPNATAGVAYKTLARCSCPAP